MLLIGLGRMVVVVIVVECWVPSRHLVEAVVARFVAASEDATLAKSRHV